MNFFEHQQQAKKNTRFLILLFIVAVIAIMVAVNFVFTFAMLFFMPEIVPLDGYDPVMQTFWYIAPKIVPVTAIVIAAISYMRMATIGKSGRAVAEYMGAQLLDLEPKELKERQLRNVVEEMAIASGVPVPDIYVLRDETGINAFAAGLEPSRAVIGVTQGLIDNLSRDEMQAVIAHEFSHIFNGDMKLNVNLLGVLGGILFLATAGRVLLEVASRSRSRGGSRKNDGKGLILLIGLGLLIIGYVGVFFGRWIKAAVSRQREFLADASAVQFTRNPQGLAGALHKILNMSSSVTNAKADEASHFFFGSIKDFNLFATHPPIKERLARLGQLHIIDVETKPSRSATASESVERVAKPQAQDLFLATTVIQGFTTDIQSKIHQPKTAFQVVLAVLGESSVDPVVKKSVETVSNEHRLKLIDLALPALRRLEPMIAKDLIMKVEAAIKKDGKILPLELAVLAILKRNLLPQPKKSPRVKNLDKLMPEALAVLRALTEATTESCREAFTAGAIHLGLAPAQINDYWQGLAQTHFSLDEALDRLAALAPHDKRIFFESLWTASHYDSIVSSEEANFLRAISEALEIPLPPTLV